MPRYTNDALDTHTLSYDCIKQPDSRKYTANMEKSKQESLLLPHVYDQYISLTPIKVSLNDTNKLSKTNRISSLSLCIQVSDDDIDSRATNISDKLQDYHKRQTITEQQLINDQVIHSGHLKQRKSINEKSWKKCWAVLRRLHLFIYKNQNEYKLKDAIHISELVNIVKLKLSGHLLAFALIGSKESWFFEASTNQERQDWIYNIRSLLLNQQECHGNSSTLSISPTLSTSSLLSPESSYSESNESSGEDCEYIIHRNDKILHCKSMPINHQQLISLEQDLLPRLKISDGPVYIQAWMKVHFGRCLGWKKRWLVLRKNQLGIYSDNDEYSLLDSIRISKILAARDSTKDDYHYVIEIELADRKLYISSGRDESLHKEWLKYLSKRT